MRYNNKPMQMWDIQSRSKFTLWSGEKYFQYCSYPQETRPAGMATGYPMITWESWNAQFPNRCHGYAYNMATGLRFSLKVKEQPYAFAIESFQTNTKVGDYPISTVSGLEEWLELNGVHPEDLLATAAVDFLSRLLRQTANVLRLAGYSDIRFEDWNGWRAWGGEF